MLINDNVVKFIMGFCSVMLVFGMFYLGGYYACSKGNGSLIGFKCVEIDDLGVCEDLLGNKYAINNISAINTTWWEN